MGYCLFLLGIFSLIWPFFACSHTFARMYAYFLGFWPTSCIPQEWYSFCILTIVPMWPTFCYSTNHAKLYYIQIENCGIIHAYCPTYGIKLAIYTNHANIPYPIKNPALIKSSVILSTYRIVNNSWWLEN